MYHGGEAKKRKAERLRNKINNREDMNNIELLTDKLYAIPNSYFGFVAGIVTYSKKKTESLKKVLDFIDSSDNLTPSDVVKFVMSQPDFHEYAYKDHSEDCNE